MIPILFEHGETEFTSNGLGRLAEAISCRVTEELNGIYELEMVYPVSGRHYEDLLFDRIIYVTHDDSKSPQPFDIYRKTSPMSGQVTVYARHISYRLNNIYVEPFEAGSCTAVFAGISSHSITENPFTFYNTVTKNASFELNHPVSVRALLCGTESMAVPQLFGGEYEWRDFGVYHREKRGRDTSIELRYGKNLTDLTHDLDVSQSYGAVIPYWLSNDGSELAHLPQWIVFGPWIDNNRIGLLDLSHEFDTFPELEDLETWAERALEESGLAVESLNVSFFELWQTEEYEHFTNLQRAYLGDSVKVVDPDLGINTTLRVVKTVYDCLLDRYDSMDLGKPSPPFASIIQQQVRNEILNIAPTKSALQLAIEHATQLITGGLGGHLVIGTDADGNPNELLIMDTTDKETAVNVLRLNLNGIGFSTTGYNGPFTTAWTIDSNFVADFITTGNLDASLLTVGAIVGRSGNCKFDLEADRISLSLDRLDIKAQSSDEDYDLSIGDAALRTMLQADLFQKLTANGTIRGLFMQNGQMFLNWDYGMGGTLKLGGNGNQWGILEMLYTDGTVGAYADYWGWHFVDNWGPATELREDYDSELRIHDHEFIYLSSKRGYANGYTGIDFDNGQDRPRSGGGGIQIYSVKYRKYLGGTKDKDAEIHLISPLISFEYEFDEDSGTHDQKRFMVMDGTGSRPFIRTGVDNYGFSDRNAKDNINVSRMDFEAVLRALRVVSFDWRKEMHCEGHVSAGLIAQEVEEVVPELVAEDSEGKKYINFVGMVPMLIGICQEQQKHIDDLERRIARLESLLS